MAKRIRMNEVPCWQEERNFTKWLADNIDCVGNIIGRNIVSACTEVKESSEYGKKHIDCVLHAAQSYHSHL